MIPLDLASVNLRSPYTVWSNAERYYFKTDFDILYAVSFDFEDVLMKESAYWFNLSNKSGRKSPGDRKIAPTIARLINAFFDANPDILLYMCDTASGQQASRNRLFLRWFNTYNKPNAYFIKTEVVQDEGVDNYVSIIVQRSNPKFDDIIRDFDEQVALLKGNK